MSKIVQQKTNVFNYALLILIVLFVNSCGDDSPTQPISETLTFSGTTRATSPTGCAGDTHVFQAGQGNVAVTLVSSTGDTGLVVQVCAGGIDNNNCTINQTVIAVGQTVNGARIGVASQTLVLQPLNCGGGGQPPDNPIDYTATVVFTRP